MKKGSISVAYKVQVDCLKDSESGSYDENDMKEKVRLYEAMQKKFKTASFSEKIQILPLVPDKWSGMYCSEYFEYLQKNKKGRWNISKICF